MKNRLIIINTHPFGKLTDCYKWCEYLRDSYEVTLICLDDETKLDMDGIKIVRVSNRGSYKLRGSRFIVTCLWHLLFFRGAIFVVYFEHCDFLKKVLFWKKMHVDVRTVDVRSLIEIDTQDKYDNEMSNACRRFDSVSVISEGVKKRLKISNAEILPLGADIISTAKKSYDSLRLLYVGTFDYRHLEETIEGLALFINKHPNIDIIYELIGDGHHKEVDECKQFVKDLHIQGKVYFRGRIDNQKLKPYFDQANVGVSYVPINPVYNVQPPTKTFEYVLSGLFCIATGTEENKKVITHHNGVIINDNPQSFCDALEFIIMHKNEIIETKIRESLGDYTWHRIVEMHLKPILGKCI